MVPAVPLAQDQQSQRIHPLHPLQFGARRWLADAALQVPLAQSMNGTGLEKDFSVRAGLRVNF